MNLHTIVKRALVGITIVVAITIKPIVYKNYRGRWVLVPINTMIYVDKSAKIALINSDHVDIYDNEYLVINN